MAIKRGRASDQSLVGDEGERFRCVGTGNVGSRTVQCERLTRTVGLSIIGPTIARW